MPKQPPTIYLIAGCNGSGKTYIRLFKRARELGFEIELHYLWLSSPSQAIARVRQRVQQGGHHVPAADIRRRFKRSLVMLFEEYLPLASRMNLKREKPTLGKTPEFAVRAERALLRTAKKVRAQNRAMNLPLIVWENGKVVEKPA